ncbi:MAG: hypothetical protein HY811_08715 [Planctomycetes bacterium]|nr:hypothetical protein [Planctomycetota bacterium]
MDSSALIGIWIAAGLTLFMYSSLYKDNPFFRFGEHLYLGLSVGYILIRVIYSNFIATLYVPLFEERDYWLIIPSILGISLYTRFFSKLAWISRITFAFLIGFGSGLGIPRIIAGGVFQQIEKIITPLGTQLTPFEYFSGILIVIGVFSVLIYFFFSWEHKGLVGGVSKVGIYFVMIAFGASFGYTVMGRMSLLIGRCYDLIDYSSSKYYYATIVLLVVIIAVLAVYELVLKKKEQPKT